LKFFLLTDTRKDTGYKIQEPRYKNQATNKEEKKRKQKKKSKKIKVYPDF